jgi:hypothetical protein
MSRNNKYPASKVSILSSKSVIDDINSIDFFKKPETGQDKRRKRREKRREIK